MSHADKLPRRGFPVWVWVATLVGLTALIVGDLVVVGRRPREVSVREASLWVACVGLAVLFGLALLIFAGSTAGAEFFAGYVTEYSLSVDNLFVFVIIMAKFAVPRQHRHRVLSLGIALFIGIIVVVLAVTTIASLLRSRSVAAKQEVEEPELAGAP